MPVRGDYGGGAPATRENGELGLAMNEELNKKLAEWAGFRLGISPYGDECLLYPDGGWARDEDMTSDFLSFTKSLDACFKWLVPKIEGLQQIILQPDEDGRWYLGMTVDDELYENIGFDLALALCLAIDKLIDSEVKA